MRNPITIGAVLAVMASCKDRAEVREPLSSQAAPVPPDVEVAVSWAGEASIYDVLGRDSTLIQLIQVPRRAPAVHPPTTPFQIATSCGPGYCVDGLATAEPRVLVPAALTADDLEILTGGDGPIENSWLERGIKITNAQPGSVSYYVADAFYTSGAAHSNARLSCRTQSERGEVRTLGAAYRNASEVNAILGAANALLAEARELSDSRLARVDVTAIDETYRELLLEGPRSLVLCLPDDQGFVQQVRVALQ